MYIYIYTDANCWGATKMKATPEACKDMIIWWLLAKLDRRSQHLQYHGNQPQLSILHTVDAPLDR